MGYVATWSSSWLWYSFLVAKCCLHNQEKQGAFRSQTHWVTALDIVGP